jgi:phosphatidylserine/phosphatidylglycerophosphate/cardiolipin synthase-like enzyme
LEFAERIRRFVAEWSVQPMPPAPREMAMLLQSVSAALAHQRQKQKIELTWTGPRSPLVSLRRTDQALIELISGARKRILIVSFAVYKAKAILTALEKAADRDVEITIVLESPDVSEGKIAYSTIRALGAGLREKSRIFVWPHAKRATTPDGKIGSLHAKIGVADGDHVYLSSANLTDYAMNVNMEMGVLIHGGELPSRIEQHFAALIGDGTLAEIAEG